MRILFPFLILLSISFVSVQATHKNPLFGTYGAYLDPATFTELTLNENNTFRFYDQFELGSTFKYTGKWKIEGEKLLLFKCQNNNIRPMPTTWKITGNELISIEPKKSKNGAHRQMTLTYKSK